MLRDHGQDRKYNSQMIGTNARMSEITAATLSIKLRYLSEWTDARRTVASWYREALEGLPGVTVFPEPDWAWSVYHLFVIEVDARDHLVASSPRPVSEPGCTIRLPFISNLRIPLSIWARAPFRAQRLLPAACSRSRCSRR